MRRAVFGVTAIVLIFVVFGRRADASTEAPPLQPTAAIVQASNPDPLGSLPIPNAATAAMVSTILVGIGVSAARYWLLDAQPTTE
jgi:hypothetical protein